MTLKELRQLFADSWQRATQHPFLTGVRDGTLAQRAFEVWLVQDYHFVRGLLPFQARCLALAPRPDQPVLVRGLGALVEELRWFEEQAARRCLSLQGPVHPVCRGYVNFLWALSFRPYVAQLVALWALERIYLEAWTHAQPGAEPYREFVEHWTNPDFRGYVEELEAAAARALGDSNPAEEQAAGAAPAGTAGH